MLLAAGSHSTTKLESWWADWRQGRHMLYRPHRGLEDAHALNFDDLPAGVGAMNTGNMINDLNLPNQSGFGHPTCDSTATMTTAGLPTTFPVGPNP
jgi:hypothetical protein